jgi:uncharacterized protein YcnI
VFVTAAAGAATLGLDVTPASAHICAVAAEIPVGEAATIAVGVTVEAATVPDVEISVPAGLRLDRVDPKAGWAITRTGGTVRYHGGPIAQFNCQYFSLGITAPTAGSFGIRVVQRAADGNVVARSAPDPANATDRALGQIVYAGVKPPSPANGSKGLSTATIAGIALVGLGAVGGGVLAFRARRDRRFDDERDERDERDSDGDVPSDRDAELRERLARFKTRTTDPPSPQ